MRLKYEPSSELLNPEPRPINQNPKPQPITSELYPPPLQVGGVPYMRASYIVYAGIVYEDTDVLGV